MNTNLQLEKLKVKLLEEKGNGKTNILTINLTNYLIRC